MGDDSPPATTADPGVAADGLQWTAAASAAIAQHARKLDAYKIALKTLAARCGVLAGTVESMKGQIDINSHALEGVVRSGGQEFQTMRDQLGELMVTAAASDHDIRQRTEMLFSSMAQDQEKIKGVLEHHVMPAIDAKLARAQQETKDAMGHLTNNIEEKIMTKMRVGEQRVVDMENKMLSMIKEMSDMRSPAQNVRAGGPFATGSGNGQPSTTAEPSTASPGNDPPWTRN